MESSAQSSKTGRSRFRRRRADQLPEERRFELVLVGACVAATVFALAFIVTTMIKAIRSPHDVTSNWFVAWGTWAGGLGAVAAFLIAAASISVASAHARTDRQQAAEIRDDNDMAQARLLAIYKVEDEWSLSSLATYRVENRSNEMFFDVTVPFVDSPHGQDGEVERRTAEIVAQENRLHEYIPTADQLTPYRDHTEDEVWFTLVAVHTSDAGGIQFVVEYTDAAGRRWSQQLGGQVTRIPTSRAVPVRKPDRFQPAQQVRRMTDVERWRSGFTTNLKPPRDDHQFLEVIEAYNVRWWDPIERIGEVEIRSIDINTPPGELVALATFGPVPPPFWPDHFHQKLKETGLRYSGGTSENTRTDKFIMSADLDLDVATVTGLVDAAIKYANGTFEQNELAAARRALDARPGFRL